LQHAHNYLTPVTLCAAYL